MWQWQWPQLPWDMLSCGSHAQLQGDGCYWALSQGVSSPGLSMLTVKGARGKDQVGSPRPKQSGGRVCRSQFLCFHRAVGGHSLGPK